MRIGAFLLVLLLLWLPIAAPIAWLVTDRNTVSILTLVLLYAEFMLLVRFWGRQVYQRPAPLRRYGLVFSRQMGLEALTGLVIGSVSLFALFVTQGMLGWVVWQTPSIALLRIAGEGLLVALGIGFAEELFFRGWLLDELQRDYQPGVALAVNAAIFALVHGIKPQFPALFVLGLTLVWAKRSCRHASGQRHATKVLRSHWDDRFGGRLGLSMGLHAGLVWGYYLVNVGMLITSSSRVPAWLTGIDRNPLAGAIGFLFLSGLAVGMGHYAQRKG